MEASVKQWMSGDPISVSIDASALEALDLMVERGIRHLPVLDPRDLVVGVLSIDDLRAAMPVPVSLQSPLSPGDREAAREFCVGEIMTHAPETAGADCSLAEAAERMAQGRFGCLPVVDDAGRLEGILSETDVLYALAASLFTERAGEKQQRPNELATLIAQLRSERQRIAARLDDVHALERQLATHPHEEPLDRSDRAADLQELSLAESLDALAARRLEAIDRALDHAKQGSLSVCDGCGGAIPLSRLRALPGTTQCVRCAREQESL
jgi:acetoin utilization protein AcuB